MTTPAANPARTKSKRAFVMMPFEAEHSNDLWRLIQSACDIWKLEARRADSLCRSRLIVEEITEEIEQSQIAVADLTTLNANVFYELGYAHAKGVPVILVCSSAQKLPFDVRGIRTIFFDLARRDGRNRFVDQLGNFLRDLSEDDLTVIRDAVKRTQSVVEDLQMLGALPDTSLRSETVWSSGFLSAFAIGDQEDSPSTALREALLAEKEALLDLARRGCQVRCIITPPDRVNRMYDAFDRPIRRLRNLISFLEHDDRAHNHIDWVISPHRQKNLYIVGSLCVVEGFKVAREHGYALTLRQTAPEAIRTTIAAHEVLFEDLKTFTLTTYPPGGSFTNNRQALRLAALNALRTALELCERMQQDQTL